MPCTPRTIRVVDFPGHAAQRWLGYQTGRAADSCANQTLVRVLSANVTTSSLSCQIQNAPLQGRLARLTSERTVGRRRYECLRFRVSTFASFQRYSNCCSADFLDHLPKVPLTLTAGTFTRHKRQAAI